jgi:3-oxoacyl-[acyl-carrier-protein] synthase II
VVSSIGLGAKGFLQGLREGRSGARPITVFDTEGFAYANGCEIKDFDPRDWIRTLETEQLGRAAQFSTAASRMALEDSGLDLAWLRERRGLISIGTTDGESYDLDQMVESELADGPGMFEPASALRVPAGRLSVSVAQELGLTNVEALTIPTACSAGNYAIGYGFDVVSSGEADFAFCGGADAMCRKTFTGFYRLGTIAADRCQPFDVDRKGILTGEGAGVLVLERLESALERDATIYAEVLGQASSSDAYHMAAPDPTAAGALRAMRWALRDAGVPLDGIDYINAHGTSTPANDAGETLAIKKLFGERAYSIPISSTKSMIGHPMGAAGALEAIACALTVHTGVIHPTINYEHPDPECDLDYVPNVAREAPVRTTLSNSFGLGGQNACLVLGRFEG